MKNTDQRYRVYFNRRGAPKGKIWCVDKGIGTRRRYFDSVTFDGGITDYRDYAPDWKNPVAWINVEGKLTVFGTHAGISARTGKKFNMGVEIKA